LLRDQLFRDHLRRVELFKTMLSSLNVAPAKRAGDVAAAKRSRLDAEVALDSEVMLVALPPTAGPKALRGPVARLVRGVLVLADKDFALGDVHRELKDRICDYMLSRDFNTRKAKSLSAVSIANLPEAVLKSPDRHFEILFRMSR
jgi:hypothetical protein